MWPLETQAQESKQAKLSISYAPLSYEEYENRL